jgi:hypothetical protein
MKKDKRTYADRRVSNVKFVVQRRKKIKLMATEYKGGKCELCGYNRCAGALDFHHIKTEEKSFSISDYGHCRA